MYAQQSSQISQRFCEDWSEFLVGALRMNHDQKFLQPENEDVWSDCA